MTSAALALQEAVFARLAGYAPLVAALGAPRVYDDAPQPANFPYVTFGQSTVRDAEASTDPGDEHLFTLHVWSRARGRRETHVIADTIRAALHDTALTLRDHRLVNLRHEFTDARRESDGDTVHGIVRFRAVTEPV